MAAAEEPAGQEILFGIVVLSIGRGVVVGQEYVVDADQNSWSKVRQDI